MYVWDKINFRFQIGRITAVTTTTNATTDLSLQQKNVLLQQPIRHSSFRSSEPIGNIEKDHPQVEILRNPIEWKYVENILAKSIVPEPEKKEEYPSGWKPQLENEIIQKLPYFVGRTKNHMIPVYLNTTFRGTRRITKLRRIQGDIWHLEENLRQAIEKTIGKRIVTRINEMSGQIWFKGDYVNIIKDYLMAQGL